MVFTEFDRDASQTRRAFLAGLGAIVSASALFRCGSDNSAIESPIASDGGAARRWRPALPATEPLMRVRVLRTVGPGAQTLIGTATQWLALETASTEGTETVLHGPVVVRLLKQSGSLTDATGLRAAVDAFEPIEMRAAIDQGATRDGNNLVDAVGELVAAILDMDPGGAMRHVTAVDIGDT